MKAIDNKIEKKQNKINSDKKILFDKIEYAENNLENNNIILIQNIDVHNEFINFLELIKVFELYKWKKLILSYNKIKKKINSDKKIYTKIIRIYGNINNYLNKEEINKINNIIIKIQNQTETMIYNYCLLQKKHHEISIKSKNLSRSSEIIKIYEITSKIKPLLSKLYKIYIDLKIINKKSILLKSMKNNILREIQNISQL